ncbi:ABC transporter ATP-binding protein [Oceanobacillus jeddahense]|uniref:ABC transporter ATP-binding protein n=1 Tax=Oceanobacillus jeddahense TaxID=1462527 RepID=UPI0036284C65
MTKLEQSVSEERINNQEILRVENLTKHYVDSTSFFGRPKSAVKALNSVSFYLKKGETLGIVGESGCGKSTLGNVIMQLIDATEGNVFYQGKNIQNMPKAELQKIKKDIQMIFQDPFSSLNPRMKIFDIIAEPFLTHKIAKGAELKKRIYNLLELVGLNRSQADRYPHEFSGGQRQRIGIARAIALHPQLVVCDEPVSALDVSIQAQILNLLKELKKELQLTFIFIGHGIPAVKYISDRIAVMYLGEIVELASTEDLFEKTFHPYTQGLISSVPVPDPSLRNESDEVFIEKDLPDQRNIPVGCSFYGRCPIAQDICKEIKPKLQEQETNHYVACHFPLHTD